MERTKPKLEPATPITKAVWYVGGLILLFILFSLILPASTETMNAYNLEEWQYKVIRLGIALPILCVWVAAFVGYASLREYSNAVKNTPEGGYFSLLARGVTWLAWSLPITVICDLFLNALGRSHPEISAGSIIIRNYIELLIPLIAFTIIGNATRQMVNHAQLKLKLSTIRIIMLLFIAAGVTYCWLVFQQLKLTGFGSADNIYHLPVWLMIITLVVPYLYVWFVGLLASYEISLVSKKVSGVLYRQALRLLAGGLVAVIISSIALQYLNGIPGRSTYLVFDYRLLMVLLFRIVGGVGFLLLALGSLKLKKIEEV
jgi:hypothetical protein